jgi:hypothetical protein
MSFPAYTHNRLVADAQLISLVPADRINFGTNGERVQSPSVFMDIISSNLAPIMENGTPSSARNDNFELQVAVYARTLFEAWTIADRIRFVLESSPNPCKYICRSQENAREDFPDLQGVILRLSAWYQSTTPSN